MDGWRSRWDENGWTALIRSDRLLSHETRVFDQLPLILNFTLVTEHDFKAHERNLLERNNIFLASRLERWFVGSEKLCFFMSVVEKRRKKEEEKLHNQITLGWLIVRHFLRSRYIWGICVSYSCRCVVACSSCHWRIHSTVAINLTGEETFDVSA